MRTFFFTILILTCYLIKAPAQNLVPNPSFEDTVDCPNNVSNYSHEEVRLAKGWDSFGGTPDYFNSCGTKAWSVPSNADGYQVASTGHAYCGMHIFYRGVINYRELIGIRLINPLIKGNKYFASMNTSCANYSRYSANNIGISFSTINYLDSISAPISNKAMVYLPSIISDTINWTTISGSFVADSNYNYIMIGNFFTDSLTDTIFNSSKIAWGGAYYYVDDVSVIPDTADGIPNIANEESVSVTPNPSKGVFNIFSLVKLNAVEIFDVQGRLLLNKEGYKNKFVLDLTDKPKGVYFLRLIAASGIVTRKLIIE